MSGVRDCSTCHYGTWEVNDIERCKKCDDTDNGGKAHLWFPRKRYNEREIKMGFVKIFALGHRVIKNIFDDEVEITEKVDGSQFSFGLINGELIARSKRASLLFDHPEDQFKPALDYVRSIADKLHPNWLYFSETLKTPKHNVLRYEKIPTNHIAIFGILDTEVQEYRNWEMMRSESERLNVDVVQRLFQGKTNLEEIKKWLDTVSFLGGEVLEGVVVKNYNQSTMIGDVVFPFMCGKLVRASFKEKHKSQAYGNAAKKDGWETFCDSFRHENRWRKAVRHLADDGTLSVEPKDIGPLVKEIQRDITEEEKDEILEFLWKLHSPHLLRKSIQGFPEWYKEQIANGEIDRILRGGDDEDVEENSCSDDGACMLPVTD